MTDDVNWVMMNQIEILAKIRTNKWIIKKKTKQNSG